MKAMCAECEEAMAKHPDPRVPPLEVGGTVLCETCFEDAKSHRIEQLQDEIDAIENIHHTA